MEPQPGIDIRSAGEPARADDGELWARLSAQDPEALGLLFDRHSRGVYNVAFRRTASWSTAEEVVQATFTTVWRKADAGELPVLTGNTALPWLLGVALHESHNLTRSLRRLQRRQGRAPAPSAVLDHADEVAARVDDERRMSVVRRAMARLPAHERVTIELVIWSGLSLAETADLLNVAEGTVKSRLARGRARLAGLLGLAIAHEESE